MGKPQRIYSKITPKIKKDLDKISDFIINELRLNIFSLSRNKLYPEYRSLFNSIVFRKYKISPSDVSRYYEEKGLKYAHDKYLYSIGKFEQYCTTYPELKSYLNLFFKETINDESNIVYLRKNDLTPIQKLVTDLTDAQEKELIELITLRKKSWEWKSKDTLKLYTGS